MLGRGRDQVADRACCDERPRPRGLASSCRRARRRGDRPPLRSRARCGDLCGARRADGHALRAQPERRRQPSAGRAHRSHGRGDGDRRFDRDVGPSERRRIGRTFEKLRLTRSGAMSDKRTLVAGGTLATEYGVFPADLLIEGELVASMADPGSSDSADEVIDATGLVVMPGAIDPHAHFEDPGHTEREDFTTGTMAAAAGGITTVIEHPLTYPPVTTATVFTVAPKRRKGNHETARKPRSGVRSSPWR